MTYISTREIAGKCRKRPVFYRTLGINNRNTVMKHVIWLALVWMACKQPATNHLNTTAKEINDPHSYANTQAVIAKHLELDLSVNFPQQKINGKASWTIDNFSNSSILILDTWKLAIERVTLGEAETPTDFSLGEHNTVFGSPLTINILPSTTVVHVYYSTAPDAGALQWLSPRQTAGKQHPFLFTQSQPILARSWVPSQDGPAVRFTYNASVKVPPGLLALMSAENPQQKSATGIYTFRQPKPIPSYLLALAVGDIAFKAVDERTGVYAEPAFIEKAAWEFADMGRMVTAAESLYGPYQWGRFDLLVLPPSFPYGGMENPMLTFATPTVIAGDKSLVSLVAHELAHSWSGNLVTNATWEDIWLNEGFTVYVEKRILQALYGDAEFRMQEVLSRQEMMEAIEELGDTSMDTRLKLNLQGRDPGEGMTNIAYEKGFAFLRTIEHEVGRQPFDNFLKEYFTRNAFQSKTTEQFIAELLQAFQHINDFEDRVRLREWIYGTGVPKNIKAVESPEFNRIDSLLNQWQQTRRPTGFAQLLSTTNERLYFLRRLPQTLTLADMKALDEAFGFTQSGNAEVQTLWFVLSVRNRYQHAYPAIERFLHAVGRRKFLRPIYGEMIKTPEGKQWAQKIYATARPNYHPVAYNTIDAMLR